MMKVVDMVGKRFSYLTVIKRDNSFHEDGRAYWICRCDCGNEITASGKLLRHNEIRSCGCKRKELLSLSQNEELSGQRFGNLTVIRRVRNPKTNKLIWLCKCDCGNEVLVKSSHLHMGGQISCGCSTYDNISYHIGSSITHGASTKSGVHGEDNRLHSIWVDMKQRCNSPNSAIYIHYGGRGIKVCDEWIGTCGFQKFRDWAYENGYDSTAPRGQCTIDRIDVNGNYEPSNCRWITQKEQIYNRRNTLYYEINGISKPLAVWCSDYGVNRDIVYKRLRRGWDIVRALSEPSHHK